MSGLALPESLQRLLAEPPPDQVFEITERSLAVVSPKEPGKGVLEMLPERGLTPSPSAPNISSADEYREVLRRLAGTAHTRRSTAALVIPDYAVRMTILDFQEFPPGEPERDALLRFRLRKSVPFHIEEAQVSYSAQVAEPGRLELLAVAIARPILSEYEEIFTAAGFRVGLVTPSSLAALPLIARSAAELPGGRNAGGLTLAAKLAGSVITVLLLQGEKVRVVRCLNLASGAGVPVHETEVESILNLMQQTAAFAEDQIGVSVNQVMLCGFGVQTEELARTMQEELQVACYPVRSRFGVPTPEDAGLLGLLEQYAA
jgi:type IV pilus assembly protein PilM